MERQKAGAWVRAVIMHRCLLTASTETRVNQEHVMQRTEKQEEGNFRLLHPVHLSSSYLGSLSQGLSAMADKQNLTIELLQTWHPTPVLLPGKSHGQRRLVGCSPWGCEELDTTERLHFRFSLSCTGEGNGNPLQCSCLENPRDGGVCGVTQSQTQLKQLSSSSSSRLGS